MMPKYRITAPDGGTYEVNAPEGATEQEIMAYAQAHHAAPIRQPLPVMKVTPNQMRGLFGGARANAVGPVINPAEDFMSAVGGAWDNMRSNQRARAARNEADAKRPIGEQIAKLPLDTVRRVGGDLQAVGDVVGVLGSPMAGITDAVLSGPFGRTLAKYGPTMYSSPDLQMKDGKLSFAPVRPLSQAEAADKSKGMMNLALMAAKPASGFKVPAKVQKPAPMASIERQAAEYVDRLLMQGGADLADVAKLPEHLTGAEAIGQKGKTGLAALARREGETADALNAAVGVRQAARPGRMLEAFGNAAGVDPEAALGDIRTLVETGRKTAAPLYEKAFASGPIETDGLKTLLNRPSVKNAMSRAVRIAAEEGIDPRAVGFEVSPASGDIPEMIRVKQPTAQTWDLVKRGLDDVLDGYRDSTTGKLNLDEEGRAVVGTLKTLRKELTDANPAYAKALEASSDYLSAENAFKTAGRDLFNANLNEIDFAEKFVKLGAGEQQAYRGGLANRFHDLAQNGKLDPKVLKTPRIRAKLDIALGRDQAQSLIDLAAQESDLLGFERRYAPNAGSITSEINAAIAEQDAMNPAREFMTDVAGGAVKDGVWRSMVSAALKQGQKGLDAVGPTRGMPVPVRDEAGRLLLSSPEDFAKTMEAYRAWKAAQDAARASELRRLGAAGRLAIPAAGANASNAKGSPSAIAPRR